MLQDLDASPNMFKGRFVLLITGVPIVFLVALVSGSVAVRTTKDPPAAAQVTSAMITSIKNKALKEKSIPKYRSALWP